MNIDKTPSHNQYDNIVHVLRIMKGELISKYLKIQYGKNLDRMGLACYR